MPKALRSKTDAPTTAALWGGFHFGTLRGPASAEVPPDHLRDALSSVIFTDEFESLRPVRSVASKFSGLEIVAYIVLGQRVLVHAARRLSRWPM